MKGDGVISYGSSKKDSLQPTKSHVKPIHLPLVMLHIVIHYCLPN